jgi:Haem-binding domain
VSKTVTNLGAPGPTRWKRNTGARVATSGLLLMWLLASVFVHPLPHDATGRASAPLLRGADVSLSVVEVFALACTNCHSDKTRWPWYSHVAPASWLVENDVKRARERLNLSRWDSLDAAEQLSLLTAIATVIENREMPLHKYVVFHEEARLSAEDSIRVIEWTRTERRRLRASASSVTGDRGEFSSGHEGIHDEDEIMGRNSNHKDNN